MIKNVANNVANEKVQDYVKKSHNIEGNEPKSEKATQDVQKNCLSLTEQWKKGELEVGECYFIRLKSGKIISQMYNFVCIDGKHHCTDFGLSYGNVDEVLAEVPDYIEWRNMVNCACEEHEANNRLIEENAKLKELLKECKQMFIAEKSFLIKCSRFEDIENIITKIDEVLNVAED